MKIELALQIASGILKIISVRMKPAKLVFPVA